MAQPPSMPRKLKQPDRSTRQSGMSECITHQLCEQAVPRAKTVGWLGFCRSLALSAASLDLFSRADK